MTILSMLRERLTEVAWQLMSLEARGGDEVQIAALRATAVALRGALKDAEQILGRPLTGRLGGSRLVSVSWTGGARLAAVKIALRDLTALDIFSADLATAAAERGETSAVWADRADAAELASRLQAAGAKDVVVAAPITTDSGDA